MLETLETITGALLEPPLVFAFGTACGIVLLALLAAVLACLGARKGEG